MATSGTVRLVRNSVKSSFHPLCFCNLLWQTGYDPKNTFINEGQLQYWLKNKVSADLESVPGVGPANKHHFVAGEL